MMSQSGHGSRQQTPNHRVRPERVSHLIARSIVAIGIVATMATAEAIMITPIKDNTLFEDAGGSLSNGAGSQLFVGRVGPTGGGTIRRTVLAFNIADQVPSGATINSAVLRLNMSQTTSGATDVALHPLSVDWGEGASVADCGPGMGQDCGANASTGDATWIHSFFDTASWAAPGGDFDAAASATVSVDGTGAYDWMSDATAADVQSWLDDPASNFGWILIGDESTEGTAKRFDSRESADPPMLTIDYTPLCSIDADCDDGVMCNGVEVCTGGNCALGTALCPGQQCRESDGACVDCLANSDCGDGIFCNGSEVCDTDTGTCMPGVDPCPDRLCRPTDGVCVDCFVDNDCVDAEPCNGIETCDSVTNLCRPGLITDCNLNNIDDSCDMASCNGAPDCSDENGNNIPDGCEELDDGDDSGVTPNDSDDTADDDADDDSSSQTTVVDASGFATIEMTSPVSGATVNIEITGGQPGSEVEVEIHDNAGAPGPAGGTTFEGFAATLALGITFEVVADDPLNDSGSVLIQLSIPLTAITEIGLVPSDVDLHVLNEQGQTPFWERAGTTFVGQSPPTMSVGEYGYFPASESVVTFWVRRSGFSVFAVGRSADGPSVMTPADDDGDESEPVDGDVATDSEGDQVDLNSPPDTDSDSDTEPTPEQPLPTMNACGAASGPCGAIGPGMILMMVLGALFMRHNA